MAPLANQVARDSAHLAAVEQQFYLVLAAALLSRVGDGPLGRRGPGTLKEGIETIDVDGRAAAHATPQREGVGVGARAGDHREGTVTPQAQHTKVGGVEQLLSPQQPLSTTVNTMSTRPASSFAFLSACAAASSSRTVAFIARIRCA